MHREQAEKLLAAFIFDDLDETSKAELLTYLQTDDELRERLADMRMAAKVASDTLQHGPDPVLGKQRLKSLARLAGRRGAGSTIFTMRRLAAAAAVLAAVLLPVSFILPSLNRVRLYAGRTDSASKFNAEYMIEDTGGSSEVSSQPTQPPGGGIESEGLFASYSGDEAWQHSVRTGIRNSSPSVREPGQTQKYSLLPPVTNGPLSSEGHYYSKSKADEIAGTQISLSGDDNLYAMGETDRIVGGQLSVPGGEMLASRSWRGSVSHDDYIANALGSEPSSGMGTGAGAGMMGGMGGMGRYGGGGEMGGMGGYGGGGYGFAAPTGAKRANEIESSGDLWRRHEGIDEGAPAIAKPEYGHGIARHDSGEMPGAGAVSGNNSETVTGGGTYSLYNNGAAAGTGLDGSTDFGKTISDSTVLSSIATDGRNVTLNDSHMDPVAAMPEGFVSVTGPAPAFPGAAGAGGASGPSDRPDLTLLTQGGLAKAGKIVAKDTDDDALFDSFGNRETAGKDYVYLDMWEVDQGGEAGKRDHEKAKLPSAISGTIKQPGLRRELSKEEAASSLDRATEKYDTTSTEYRGRPVVIFDRLGVLREEEAGVDYDSSLPAIEPVKPETNIRLPLLGDVPVMRGLHDRKGGRSALPEEQAQRTYGFDYIRSGSEDSYTFEDIMSALEDKAERTESESSISAYPPVELMKQKVGQDADSKKAKEWSEEAKKLLPHRPTITAGAGTTESTAEPLPSIGEPKLKLENVTDGDMVVVNRRRTDAGNINLLDKEVKTVSSAPDDASIVAETMTDSKPVRRTRSSESDFEVPISQPEGEPVEMGRETIQLQHAEPREVKDAAADLFRELPGMQSASGVSIEALTENRQIIVSGSKDMREKVKNMVQAIDNRRPQVLADVNSIVVEEDGTDLPEASRFKLVPVNPWVMTGRDSLSTFALDVDTASYTLCRRYIRGGFLPPPGAVRMEEFINYFNYQYPQRANPTFKVHAEAAQSPFAGKGKDLTLLKIGVKARTIGRDQRRAANLIFVVDASASMGRPDRLPLVQKALGLLVDKLSPEDRVSLITCADQARLHMEATSARQRDKIRNAIEAIQPSGATNLLAGLKLGYATARKAFAPKQINHVILCSDGVANVGQTEAEEILKEVSADRKQGITITCVGVGYGTYNDAFLEALANRGDGSYVFLDSAGQAQRVFVEQLAATLQTVAKDARIQVDFNPDRVRRYRLIGYENRDIEDKRFRDDTIDAGEVGSGQCSTALYELELTGGSSKEDLGTVFVRYRHAETGRIEEISSRLESSVVRRRTVESAPRFYLAACAVRFAEILRQSEHIQDGNLTDVSRLADQVSLALPLDRDVRELAELIRKAEHLPASP